MENGFIDVIIQAREQTIYKHCVAMKNYNNENANEDYSRKNKKEQRKASTKSGKLLKAKTRGRETEKGRNDRKAMSRMKESYLFI